MTPQTIRIPAVLAAVAGAAIVAFNVAGAPAHPVAAQIPVYTATVLTPEPSRNITAVPSENITPVPNRPTSGTPSVSVVKTPGYVAGIGVLTNISGTGFNRWAGRSLEFVVIDENDTVWVDRKVGVLVDGTITTTVGDAELDIGHYFFGFLTLDDQTVVAAGEFDVLACDFPWDLDVPCRGV